MTNYLTMTEKELKINTIMEKVMKKELTIKEASKLMEKSERQTKRIKKRYKEEWPSGLIHKARWKPSNNKIEDEKYSQTIEIIKEKYPDYWPTLSSEKLLEKHTIKIPVSTLRLQMIKNWIWKSKVQKSEVKQFTARERKESYWEMVQYDWSYHPWFENRKETWYQCLLVWVDDATWEVTAKFAQNEWLFETMRFWKEYMLEKWKPQSIYLDKFATYKVNYPNATDDKELPTQFNRACKQLWIKLIFANTPQAKWRVERMNATLQDRLVKALREENISDINTANKFLKEIFLPDFNNKFMREARNNNDLNLKLREDEENRLEQIFSKHIERKIANDFTVKIDNKFYQLFRKKDWWYKISPKETVTVEIHLNWDIKISKNGIYIEHKISFERPERQFKLLTAPICEKNLEEMKQNILNIEEIQKENKKNLKENKNIDTYYEKYWKSHPFVANAF